MINYILAKVIAGAVMGAMLGALGWFIHRQKVRTETALASGQVTQADIRRRKLIATAIGLGGVMLVGLLASL